MKFAIFKVAMPKIAVAAAVLVVAGCSVLASKDEETWSSADDASVEPRIVAVFIDGTRNSPDSKTNVFLMKEALRASGKRVVVDYIPGVGTASGSQLSGAVLGFKMEEGILKGYRFLSQAARPQDNILIFGFSRGAHQARALAGLVAYTGLMDATGQSERGSLVQANKILELTKAYSDDMVAQQFIQSPQVPPLLAKVAQETGNKMRAATIDFLGVWDTVPGSSFKEYENCREKPDRQPGERYKTGSYPLIRQISHAVSLDEKRSMFSPVLLCQPLVAARTRINEVGFAGAHSDVGGGYEDDQLNTITLNWMADQASVATHGRLSVPAASPPDGLAHWSFGGASSAGSTCDNRTLPNTLISHPSVAMRVAKGRAPIKVNGTVRDEPYPLPNLCPSS